MKSQKKQMDSKVNVKELALEKLRSTEGGSNPIIDTIKDIIFAGGIFRRLKN